MIWVSFLVRNLEPEILAALTEDATEEPARSLSDVMRQVLCDHYELDCPPTGAGTRLEFGARTQLLKMHPDLWQAVKTDSEETGQSMQALVHEALSAHYAERQAA